MSILQELLDCIGFGQLIPIPVLKISICLVKSVVVLEEHWSGKLNSS